jgi:signal transduction histidine kinase
LTTVKHQLCSSWRINLKFKDRRKRGYGVIEALQVGRASGVEVAYLSYRHVVISTLPALTQQSTVLDDGPGVPDDVRQSLFQPFVSEGKQKGTGLGLTLVNSIAVEHGGTAELLSTRPGETIFRMKIMRVSGSIVPEPAPIQSEVVIR